MTQRFEYPNRFVPACVALATRTGSIMRTYTLPFLALAFALHAPASAQAPKFALRGGAAMVEDIHVGFAGALDFKPGDAPFAFSPSMEMISGEGLNRRYLAISVLLMKPLDGSGLYGGAGVGTTHWSYEGTSRDALVYDALVGYRRMTSQKIGFYGQARFFVNSKTNSDTDAFNNRTTNAAFLFDNDLVASVGIFVIVP